MKRCTSVWVGVLLLASMAAVAQARDDKAKDEKAKPGKASVGTITAVAEDHSSFTVKMGEADQSHKRTFKVTDSTTFTIDGQSATAAEVLVVGTRVKVRYEGDTALSVAVKTKEKGKASDGAEDGGKGKDKSKDTGAQEGKKGGEKGKKK